MGPLRSTLNTMRKCPAGRYNDETGGTSLEESCKTCGKGFFCERAMINPRPCGRGRYGSTEGLQSSNCTGLCPAWHFCFAGTTSEMGAEECKSCPAGFATEGKSASTKCT